MAVLRLPNKGRPFGVRYRTCDLGVDLPGHFVQDLKGLDKHLYPIFHPYKILWDDMVNEYLGTNNDPRYSVLLNSSRAGELIMGHILTNGQDVPSPDGSWHIWRWCEPAGAWAHIVNIECKDELYLRLLVKRLWLQDQFLNKYGNHGYQKQLEEADMERRDKMHKEKAELMNDIYDANSAMVNRAMQNFKYGRTAATRPTKDIIMSGSGISKRSKITREITDREGGIILPPGVSED